MSDLNPWVFYAKVLKITDADTLDLLVDQGFGGSQEVTLRFSRIDAWEERGPEREKGKAATAYLETLISVGDKILIKTEVNKKNKTKKGSFGRYLMEVYLLTGENVGDMLLKEGHAVLYGEK